VSYESRHLEREGCDANAAAYALGALEPAEADAFERHLQACPLCAEEVAAFEDVTDTLAMSPAQYPTPPGLRHRVMASVRSERRRRRAAARRWSCAPIAIVSRWSRTHTALATATLVLVSATIVIAGLLPRGPSQVRVIQAKVAGSGSAQVRLADNRAELIVRDFQAPAAGDIYELWLKRPGRPPEPTRTLFSVTAQGAGDIAVPGTVSGADEILVTQEPAGGSLVRTHPPLIVARLS
jgi:anti-sigma-K factor RskA